MTLEEAMALQPEWVAIWVYILVAGAFVAPLVLLIWKASRKAGIITFIASILAAFGIQMMFDAMGYVKLLGLPHLILWVPIVVFLVVQQARGDMPNWPRRIIWFITTIICISLVFDFIDVVRWVLGERAPLV
jgi:FtsH-binding integral membrane protein